MEQTFKVLNRKCYSLYRWKYLDAVTIYDKTKLHSFLFYAREHNRYDNISSIIYKYSFYSVDLYYSKLISYHACELNNASLILPVDTWALSVHIFSLLADKDFTYIHLMPLNNFTPRHPIIVLVYNLAQIKQIGFTN